MDSRRYRVNDLGEQHDLILYGFYSLYKIDSDCQFLDLVIRLYRSELLYPDDMNIISSNILILKHAYFREKFCDYINQGGKISDLIMYLKVVSSLKLDIFTVNRDNRDRVDKIDVTRDNRDNRNGDNSDRDNKDRDSRNGDNRDSRNGDNRDNRNGDNSDRDNKDRDSRNGDNRDSRNGDNRDSRNGDNRDRDTDKVNISVDSKNVTNKMPIVTYPVTTRYTSQFILENRKRIYDEFLLYNSRINNNIYVITSVDVRKLYNLYNKYFFNSTLPVIKCDASNKMTCSAANYSHKFNYNTKMLKDQRIALSIPITRSIFSESKKPLKNDGIMVHNRLESIQISLEHELVHLILSNSKFRIDNPDHKINKQHGYYFKQLSYAFFMHTEFRHNLC